MTTKTGEALRGRKRDPEVLAKAWATRRANFAKKLREAKRAKNARVEMQRSAGGLMIPVRVPTGSTKHTRKAAKAPKARTSRARIGRRSNVVAQAAADEIKRLMSVENQFENAARGRDTATPAIGASSDAEGANLVAPIDSLAVTARVLMVEARKKNGGEVERVLREAVHTGRMEEQRGILEATARQRREHLRVTDQKIVCGFIAEVDMAMSQGRGGLAPDEVWNLNSFTVTRIVNALNAAGYYGKGFRDPVTR